VSSEALPRSLPDSILDPSDVQAAVPDLTDDDARRCSELATLALEAFVWPADRPEPVPPPMYLATLRMAIRLAVSGSTPGGGQVVSESIGTYTYRLRAPTESDVALEFNGSELALLRRAGFGPSNIGQMDIGGDGGYRPFDWWQRDYDDELAASSSSGSREPERILPELERGP
jgi:hypothetical protein